jgi:acetamidase/formamidase
MPETLIKVDLNQSPYENENIHNRWHPDIPMATWVNPGDDFVLETYDWTGGFIKNNNSADDVRDIDLSIVHFLSGPVGVKGAKPGDLLVVELLDIGAKQESMWGFNGFFSKKNGGGFLTEFGAVPSTPEHLRQLRQVMALADQHLQSWAYWSFKVQTADWRSLYINMLCLKGDFYNRSWL